MDVSTIDERVREIIRRFLQELPATSNGRIARIVGCELRVVSQIRRELLDAGELRRHVDIVDGDDR